MKHFILLLMLLVGIGTSYAQTAPKGMNYQAVARDLKGNVLANQDIDIKIELTSLQSGKEVIFYSEVHKVTTNQLGLFTLIVGEGKSSTSGYENIPWSTEDIFMNIAIGDKSTNAFTTISSSKLLAVPYAYHAVTASQLLGDESLEERAAKEEYWMLAGNQTAGQPKPKFGTRDCADIMVITNNVERMRVFCDGNINMDNSLTVGNNVTIGNNLEVYADVVLNTNYKSDFSQTIVNGKFTVANRQPTFLTGELTVDKNVWFKSKLRVDLSTNLNDSLTVNNMAPTYLSGKLTVDKNTWLKSKLRVDLSTNLNDSLSVNNAKPTYLSGKLTADLASWLKSTLRVDGITDLNAALNVNNVSPTYLSGTLTVDRNTWLKNKLRVDQSTTLNDSLTVTNMKPTLLTGVLQTNLKATFKDQVILDNPVFQSTSVGTGALVVNGGVGIGKNLWIGGEFHTLGPVKLESSLDVNGPANFFGTLTGHKFTDLKARLRVGGATKLDSILTVEGATDLNSTLNVDGTTTTRALNANGQVTINAALGTSEGSYGSYPLRVEGSGQGIAIKLTAGTPDNSSNFVTFFNNGGGAVGAIEGETAGEVASDPEYIFDLSILVAEEIKAGVNVGLSAIPVVVAGLGASAGPCGACIAMAAADLVLATANLVAFNVFAFENLGVTYSSGSADYAEWLERMNPSERIFAGEIVGVNGGKISKYTTNAQHLMVISTKPAILGNLPKSGTEPLYEKVAFMGQIPVKVKGLVISGDYILPSGLNDGQGIAVSPDKITPAQYKNIVGVAWSGSLNIDGVSLVNMAIGLNSNDLARLAEQQEKRITEIEDKFKTFEDRLIALEKGTDVKSSPMPTEVKTDKQEVQPQQSREAMAYANMPSELSAEVMNEAMQYLQNQYAANGVDITKHAGLNKLFNDVTFRANVIKKTQDNYKITYQSVMTSKK